MPPTCVLYSVLPTRVLYFATYLCSVQFTTYLCSVQYTTYLCSVQYTTYLFSVHYTTYLCSVLVRPANWVTIMLVAFCQESLDTPVFSPQIDWVHVDGDKLSVMSEKFNLCYNMS
jgi:hypothetical protein